MTPVGLVVAAFAWNFLTIASYSIIGPARGALLMADFGPATLPWVYMASAALTGVVVWGYQRFTTAPRRRLIGGALVMLVLTLAGGALAVRVCDSRAVAFVYFLWTDVFGIMSVTLFWTYANDVFEPSAARSIFGLVAAGAPVGAMSGAWFVRAFVARLGPVPVLLVASGVFALVLPLFLYMDSHAAPGPRTAQAAPPPDRGVLRVIAAEPFLIFLTLLVGLERLVPDFTNYIYSAAAHQTFGHDARAMAVYFADVNFKTSIGSFIVGAFLVAPILRRAGVGACLATAGLANLGLFLAYPSVPGLGLSAVFFGLDGVTRYTLFKTAKESTYSATGKEVIYRVKAFIEMFVYRLARGAAGFLLLLAGALGGGIEGAALLGAPLALLWVYCSVRVGRERSLLRGCD